MNQRRLLRCAAALALLASAGCGTSKQAPDETNGGATVDTATLTKLDLTSGAFQDGQPISVQYTCDGANQSPPLAWGDPPEGTRSFALAIDDPDAPSGTFRHWRGCRTPPNARSMAAGQQIGTQGTNDFGKLGYGGRCPPKGHGAHHYHFRLFALNVDKLGLGPQAKVKDVEAAAAGHAIAEGELVGTYQRL